MVIIGILLTVMVAVIFYQVILRYIFHNANTWSEELARYAMMWIVMLGSPVAFRRHKHISVDLFIEKVPETPRRIITFAMYAVTVYFLCMLFKGGLTMMLNARVQKSPGLHLNMAVMYLSTLVGPVLMTVYVIENLYNEIIAPVLTRRRGGEDTV